MTTNLCGYGRNGENEMGFSWDGLTRGIDIAFAKHCFTTKPKFHIPCTVCGCFGFCALHQCQRTALQSETGVWFGRCGVVCSLTTQSRIARTKGPPHEPSWFSPRRGSCSRQLFSLSHTLSTRHFCRAGHVSFQLHVLLLLTLDRSLLLEVVLASVDRTFVLMGSD